MIFYHFTTLDHMADIARDGLSKGAVYCTRDDLDDDIRTRDQRHAPAHIRNGVWLTTSQNPEGNGFGVKPTADTCGKADVRITVELSTASKKLVRWSKWAARHVEPLVEKRLKETGDGWRTWWIYFDVIPPHKIKAIKLLPENIHPKMLELFSSTVEIIRNGDTDRLGAI